MLHESNFYTLLMARMRNDELIRNAEVARMRRLALAGNRDKGRKPAVIAHILEGAGNALISTGNRLLKIA